MSGSDMKKTGIALLRFTYLLSLACLYNALRAIDKLIESTFSPAEKNDRERRLINRNIK